MFHYLHYELNLNLLTLNTAQYNIFILVMKGHKSVNIKEPDIYLEDERGTTNNYFDGETYQQGEPVKHSNQEKSIAQNAKGKRPALRRQETMLVLEPKESLCSSLKTIFTASDEAIFHRCGDDALQYLRFQRYIICYLLIVMILSICVILPLNFQGNINLLTRTKPHDFIHIQFLISV